MIELAEKPVAADDTATITSDENLLAQVPLDHPVVASTCEAVSIATPDAFNSITVASSRAGHTKPFVSPYSLVGLHAQVVTAASIDKHQSLQACTEPVAGRGDKDVEPVDVAVIARQPKQHCFMPVLNQGAAKCGRAQTPTAMEEELQVVQAPCRTMRRQLRNRRQRCRVR
jgi:hypothetical protein